MLNKIISNKPYNLIDYLEKLIANAYLIQVLFKREFKIKYNRTYLGIGWFLLQPLFVVLVYSIFFKYIVKINSDNIPYPSFVFSGLVIWYLFTGIVSKCSFSLIESSELINKVNFPRLIILISNCIPVIIENFILLMILIILLSFNLIDSELNVFNILFYFIETIVFSFGLGIILSTIALKFRDAAHSIAFVFNFMIWLTPVFFPLSIIPNEYRNWLLICNPLASIIEGLRGALFFHQAIKMQSFVLFILASFLLFLSFYYFVKFEKKIIENL